MGQSGVSEQRGHTTDGSRPSENCFVARPVSEQANEREKVINKVHSILQSLNIPVTRYESELDSLNYIVSNFSDSLKRKCLSNSNLNDQISR